MAVPVDNAVTAAAKIANANANGNLTTHTTAESNSSTPRPISINARAVPSGKQVVALFDHEADAEDELSFQLNDRIDVMDDTDDGWWYGRNVKTSAMGLFPANYVKSM